MENHPSHSLYHWVAAGFGSGWLPKAPGTWGSLAALPVGYGLLQAGGLLLLCVITLLTLIVGCWVCSVVLPQLEDEDPGWIVVDEWVGQWVTLAMVVWLFEMSVVNWLLVFLAFRGFDILKPFPIRQVEHLGPPWWSIMADDLLAGVMGGIVISAILYGLSL